MVSLRIEAVTRVSAVVTERRPLPYRVKFPVIEAIESSYLRVPVGTVL